MKKSLIFTSAIALTLLVSGGLTLAISSANATNSSSTENNVVAALTNQTSLGAALTPNKNETVYVITDRTGAPTKTFIGSTLETSESNLPVDLNIKYYLDGKEISAADLAGQSGHVKIVFNYSATAKYQDKLVPFLSLTGLQLDGTKFKNVKVTNGKIISEGDNITVAGYALAGLNYDLGTDLLPESFTLEADATNFELGTTYTLATNEIFTDLDTSKLSTVDDLVNSMNQLGSGIDQILTGATQLDSGIDSLATGITKLQSGATDLNNGANQLASGATELSTGLNTLSENSENLQSGATQTFNVFLSQTSASINANQTLAYLIQNYGPAFGLTYPISLSINGYSDTLTKIIFLINYVQGDPSEIESAKTSLDSYNEFYVGLIAYTTGVSQATTGATELSSGANQLLDGTVALKTGVDTLASGATQLSSGSKTLKAGIATFKSEGIDRLVNFANQNLANFTANARTTISAARSYKNYKSPTANSVKFIFKTPSIK